MVLPGIASGGNTFARRLRQAMNTPLSCSSWKVALLKAGIRYRSRICARRRADRPDALRANSSESMTPKHREHGLGELAGSTDSKGDLRGLPDSSCCFDVLGTGCGGINRSIKPRDPATSPAGFKVLRCCWAINSSYAPASAWARHVGELPARGWSDARHSGRGRRGSVR